MLSSDLVELHRRSEARLGDARPGKLVFWRGEQKKNIVVHPRWYIDLICAKPKRIRPPKGALPREVNFHDNEIGMFIEWASPTPTGSCEPVIFVPRFGLFNTWRGWAAE